MIVYITPGNTGQYAWEFTNDVTLANGDALRSTTEHGNLTVWIERANHTIEHIKVIHGPKPGQ